MTKVIVTILTALFIISCSKTNVCVCTDTSTGVESSRYTINARKLNAKRLCEGNNDKANVTQCKIQ